MTIYVILPGLLLLFIYIIIDFIRHRTRNLLWRLIFYSLAFYGIMVLHVTTGGINIPPRPFPWAPPVQLVPLDIVREMVQGVASRGFVWFGSSTARLNFLNLLMLMPLGVYLPLLFKVKSVGRVALTAGLVSFFIEVGQMITTYTGLTRPRGFNVDDIILNTLGAVLAFLVYRSLSPYLAPVIEKVEKSV
ncbi:MAG: VanZ family protein [Firmicutes bacterium]|nr:VanZ family protein [Bacillota bacterium]